MNKFFRNIRQKLISESKLTNYMIYTIGEIVLVVIGILIALQINFRSHYKDEYIVEVKIMRDIQNNLKYLLNAIPYKNSTVQVRIVYAENNIRSLNKLIE